MTPAQANERFHDSTFWDIDRTARFPKCVYHRADGTTDFYDKNEIPHDVFKDLFPNEAQKSDDKSKGELTGGLYSELMKVRHEINKRRCERIVFQEPVLVRDGEPVLFLRTILLLQAKFGRHKSRMVENICSAILKRANFEADNAHVGFRLNTTDDCAVLYVDTERSITESFPFALQNILANAGYSHDAELPNFDFISLVSIPRESRFDLFAEYLNQKREQYKGKHLIVVLDVLTDLVTNFNDVRESMRLIDLLNSTINQYDVSFIAIIHENVNSDKARGHIGSEALNKASTVVALDFVSNQAEQETDVVCVRYLKCRNSRKHEPFYVQYDSAVRNLVVTDKPANAENKEAQKRNLIASVFHGVRMTRRGFARDYAAIKGLSSESKAGFNVFQDAEKIGWIIKDTERTESGDELFWFYTDKPTTTDSTPETESFL